MQGRLVRTVAIFSLPLVMLAAPILAGDLNPPSAPTSTMKTLDEISGSWHRILPVADRFKLVMPTTANPAGEAVLDKETGLVWEKSPDTTLQVWMDALSSCLNATVGGRMGWRLPTVEELASLRALHGSSYPLLPTGHPFINVQSTQFPYYWAASSFAAFGSGQWVVGFGSGIPVTVDKGGTGTNYVWCVRGGRGLDG
jgi:uncharacterized protein DUF1566